MSTTNEKYREDLTAYLLEVGTGNGFLKGTLPGLRRIPGHGRCTPLGQGLAEVQGRVVQFLPERPEMDHIEDCIANYANTMSSQLFAELSNGNEAFLHEHTTFQEDLKKAVCLMAKWLQI